jgi:hypothetical protein
MIAAVYGVCEVVKGENFDKVVLKGGRQENKRVNEINKSEKETTTVLASAYRGAYEGIAMVVCQKETYGIT